jgi:GT2 family glycosyltransferase
VVHFLEQCLISVQEACKNIDFEIVVVDNHSSDASCEMIEKKFPQVELICNKKNLGFAKANNQGVAKAVGNYVLILNPDTLLEEDSLDRVLSFIKTQKNPGAVGIRFIDGTGNFLPESKRNIPTLKVAGQKLRGNPELYYAGHISENETAEVEVLTGAFMMIKREVYLKAGGFDEDYFMFGEDIDLSYKLLNAGYRNYYYGESTMIHYKGESTVKDTGYLKNFYGAMQIFYKKHFKTGKVSENLSKLAVKTLIMAGSVKVKQQKSEERRIFKRILYFGDDPEALKKIRKANPQAEIKMISYLPEDRSFYDCVIFDGNFLPAKEIISLTESLKSEKITKRILPGGCDFYIGSDSPVNRGEVIVFS